VEPGRTYNLLPPPKKKKNFTVNMLDAKWKREMEEKSISENMW
jgi:hypothetical protein